MKQTCKVENHFQKPLSFICTNPECQQNRLICFRCLEHGHKECLGFILEIEDIYKRNLPGNLNWLQNEEVKQALLLVQKHKESVPKGEVFGSIEEIVDREFNRVLIHFSGKVLEVKEKVLDDVKKRLFSEDVSLKDFEEQLKQLYNFDAVLGILDYFQIGEKDLNAITKELSIFFSETDLKDVQSSELSYIANKVNNLTQSLLDMNESLFTKLKNSVPMDILNACIGNNLAVVENSTWTWDPINKSEEIELSENNTIAIKTAYYSGSKRAVIGNRLLSNDHFIWAIDLAGSTPHRPCFVNFAGYNTVLGIVESHLIHDVENPSLTNIIGFSLSGKMHNMDEVSKILDFRERTYVFDLDLVNGTFRVLTDGEVVLCEKTLDIKGKTFLPVVLLYCVHDKISLIVK